MRMNIFKYSHGLAAGMLALAMLACNNTGPTATQPPGDNIPATAIQTLEGGANDNTPPTESPATEVSTNPTLTTSNACNNPYAPVVAGASWGYKLTGPIPDTFTHVILSVESDGFLEQDQFGSGVTRQGRWKCDNGNLIALNPPAGDSASVSAEGVTVQFETKELSGVTIPASIHVGDTWTQSLTLEGTQTINRVSYPARNQLKSTCTAIGRESVTVDAGVFDALRIECRTEMNISIGFDVNNPTLSSLSLAGINWYVENVGLVKTFTSSPGFETTTELVYYNIPQYR